MSRIDNYLRSMVRFGATGLVLKSDSHVVLRFPGGDRHATQTTSHSQLSSMVREIAPAESHDQIDSGELVTFLYRCEGSDYQVELTPTAGQWKVVLEPHVPDLELPSEIDDVLLGGDFGGADESPGLGAAGLISKSTTFGLGPEAPVEPAAPPASPTPAAGRGQVDPLGATGMVPAVDIPVRASSELGRASTVLAAEPVAQPAGPALGSRPPVAPLASRGAPVPTPAVDAPAVRAAPAIVPRNDQWVDGILRAMIAAGASDLHLSSHCPPYWRVDGELAAIPGQDVLEPGWLLERLMVMTPETNRREFEARSDTDFAYPLEGLSRFRVNIFRDRRGPGAVMRAIPFEIPSAESLGLSRAILELAELSKGLVLVTGPTASGKSTTLAALLDQINSSRSVHVITIEDPIEFVHENKKCLINQRELLTHTESFKTALRAAVREDPDVVLVGELRDLETIEIALETAETGHLVFGTLPTTTAPATVDRIIDQFPPDRQEQVRLMLAKCLRGVISQVLCRKKGGGRVAAHEILIGNSAVENLIRERKTFQLFSVMQTGRNLGMQTMEDALLDLVKLGRVEPSAALAVANNRAEFKNSLTRLGIGL